MDEFRYCYTILRVMRWLDLISFKPYADAVNIVYEREVEAAGRIFRTKSVFFK